MMDVEKIDLYTRNGQILLPIQADRGREGESGSEKNDRNKNHVHAWNFFVFDFQILCPADELFAFA